MSGAADPLDRGHAGDAAAPPAESDGLEAGAFTVWLGAMRRSLADGTASEVPCGSCSACCTSSQFVLVGPDDVAARAAIPPALLFPAPGRPKGYSLLPYDERGHCPMLEAGRCSIYAARPATCRTYDCRVFAAAGEQPDGGRQPAIATQATRWRFDHPTEEDGAAHDAVRAAARFLRDHGRELPEAAVADHPAARAVAAVALHDLFVSGSPTVGEVAVALSERRRPPG